MVKAVPLLAGITLLVLVLDMLVSRTWLGGGGADRLSFVGFLHKDVAQQLKCVWLLQVLQQRARSYFLNLSHGSTRGTNTLDCVSPIVKHPYRSPGLPHLDLSDHLSPFLMLA